MSLFKQLLLPTNCQDLLLKNLPVFVPGTTYNREEYTGCFFSLVLPKYSKYKTPSNLACDLALRKFRGGGG